MKVIDIELLRFRREGFTLAVDGLSIGAGEKVALIGHNGSGKTSLLECLMGLVPFEGRVSVLGLEPVSQSRELLPRISYCMQNPDDQLFCATVREDLLFGPRNFRLPESDAALIDAVVDQIDIRPWLERDTHALSYGEKKSCALGIALITKPDVLLLDEPFSMLDNRQKNRLLETLLRLTPTLLIASHDFSLVSRLCNRILVLQQGRLVHDGGVEALDDPDFLKKVSLL